MNVNLRCNGFLKHAELFKKAVSDRISVDFADGGITVDLLIDKTIGEKESFLMRKLSIMCCLSM